MHYNTRRYHRRMNAMRELLGGKCHTCGDDKNLQFHHVNKADKLFTISMEADKPIDQLIAEVKKCELRCVRCHKKEHESIHGIGRYRWRKCRCDICKAAWSAKTKEYKLAAKVKRLTSLTN